VYFAAPTRDKNTGLNITDPGCVELNGDQSLQFARSRYLQTYNSQTGEWEDASPRGDLDRIVRQQNFIRRLADVAARKSGSNPLTALEVADAIVPKLTIDEQLGKQDIFRLVNTFRKVNPNDDSAVEMLTIPVEESSTDQGQVVLKQPDADSVLARLRSFGAPKAEFDEDLLPAQVRVRVLNASGEDGEAGQALTKFQSYSFAPAGVGTVDILEATEIHFRPGNEDKALLVAGYMKGIGQVVADDNISDADVVVYLGQDFAGVEKLSKQSLKTTTTTKAPKSDETSETTAPPATGC
jgi:hypothetical protein